MITKMKSFGELALLLLIAVAACIWFWGMPTTHESAQGNGANPEVRVVPPPNRDLATQVISTDEQPSRPSLHDSALHLPPWRAGTSSVAANLHNLPVDASLSSRAAETHPVETSPDFVSDGEQRTRPTADGSLSANGVVYTFAQLAGHPETTMVMTGGGVPKFALSTKVLTLLLNSKDLTAEQKVDALLTYPLLVSLDQTPYENVVGEIERLENETPSNHPNYLVATEITDIPELRTLAFGVPQAIQARIDSGETNIPASTYTK